MITTKRKRGQSTVEFVLMLATVVAMMTLFIHYFYIDITGLFFSVVGNILG